MNSFQSVALEWQKAKQDKMEHANNVRAERWNAMKEMAAEADILLDGRRSAAKKLKQQQELTQP